MGMELLKLGEVTSLLTGVLGLALGFVPAVLMDRAISASKAPEFSILKQLR